MIRDVSAGRTRCCCCCCCCRPRAWATAAAITVAGGEGVIYCGGRCYDVSGRVTDYQRGAKNQQHGPREIDKLAGKSADRRRHDRVLQPLRTRNTLYIVRSCVALAPTTAKTAEATQITRPDATNRIEVDETEKRGAKTNVAQKKAAIVAFAAKRANFAKRN